MSTLNIDLTEIKTFESTTDWWDKNGSFKALHDINPLRLAFIAESVDLKGKRVLDVGSGGGILAESLAHSGANVTGIDMSETAIQMAEQHALDHGMSISYQKTTVENFAETDSEKFDVITCMELLEHVPDPVSIIKSCAQLIKPGGFVFVSTLNRTPKAYLFGVLAAEYILRLVPKGIHHYEQFIKPSELAAWAREANLEPVKIQGITYNPLTQQYRLAENVQINYLMAFKAC